MLFNIPKLFNFAIRISINIINNLKVKGVNNKEGLAFSYYFHIISCLEKMVLINVLKMPDRVSNDYQKLR